MIVCKNILNKEKGTKKLIIVVLRDFEDGEDENKAKLVFKCINDLWEEKCKDENINDYFDVQIIEIHENTDDKFEDDVKNLRNTIDNYLSHHPDQSEFNMSAKLFREQFGIIEYCCKYLTKNCEFAINKLKCENMMLNTIIEFQNDIDLANSYRDISIEYKLKLEDIFNFAESQFLAKAVSYEKHLQDENTMELFYKIKEKLDDNFKILINKKKEELYFYYIQNNILFKVKMSLYLNKYDYYIQKIEDEFDQSNGLVEEIDEIILINTLKFTKDLKRLIPQNFELEHYIFDIEHIFDNEKL